MKASSQKGAESNEIAFRERTSSIKTSRVVFDLIVGCISAVCAPHANTRENDSVPTAAAPQMCGLSRERAAGIDDAKVTPKRMNFRLELILMLLAVAAIGFVGLGTACAADGELISPKSVPKIGSFYRMQRQTPPLPFNPFPDLPVYAVDWYRHIFLGEGAEGSGRGRGIG